MARGDRGGRRRSRRCCGACSRRPTRRGAPRWASCGTTRARGPTTRATAPCSGQWVTDNWNPLYIAPVFTGLEYASVPRVRRRALAGSQRVDARGRRCRCCCLVRPCGGWAGPRPGVIAAGLLATNYVWVMYSRAALMEASMVAFMVASFWAAVRADDSPPWGLAGRTGRARRVLHQGRSGVVRRRPRPGVGGHAARGVARLAVAPRSPAARGRGVLRRSCWRA